MSIREIRKITFDFTFRFVFIHRNCLQIFECLLFETDDLIMRKNEKHVILCLLEVARRGAKFGKQDTFSSTALFRCARMKKSVNWNLFSHLQLRHAGADAGTNGEAN